MTTPGTAVYSKKVSAGFVLICTSIKMVKLANGVYFGNMAVQ